MAATGKTPILLYGSTTATNVPVAGNLTNSSDGCEIAINVADKNLFFKDSTNAVNTVPIRQSSGSSDGWLSSANWTTFNSKQTAYTNLTTIGSLANATGWLYNNGSGTFSYSTPSASDVGAVPTTRTISTTSPLAGGGDLSANRTLSISQATTSTSGYLSSTDWNTFNNKQPAGTYVTSVTGTAPVVSSGGTTPAISMAAANGSTNGYLSSTDWTTFNSKVSSQWTTTGSNIYYTTGNVGVGNSTVTAKLQVLGNSNTSCLNVCNVANSDTGAYINASGSAEMMMSAGANYNSYSAPNFVMNAKTTVANGIYLNGADCKWWANSGLTAGTTFNQTTVATLAGSTGNLTLSTGNLVIGTSGKGIDFSATSDGSGTATSELLADYEEGTWDPAFAPTSGAFGTVTYAFKNATYTKVGNTVRVNCAMRTTAFAVGTGTGTVIITGLPYTSGSTANAGVAVGYSVNFTTNQPSSGIIAASSTSIALYYRATANGISQGLPVSDLQNGANLNYIVLTAVYNV